MGGIEMNTRETRKAKKEMALASTLKTNIMHYLINNGESNTKTLSKNLDIHQSSISHAIKEMVEEDLVARTARGYQLTNVGKVYMHISDLVKASFEGIEQQKDLYLNHDLNTLAIEYQVFISMISSRQVRMQADFSMPYRKQEYITTILSKSKDIRVVSSIVIYDHLVAVVNAISNGASAKLIATDNLIQATNKTYAGLIKGALVSRNLELYRIKDLKLCLVITESHLFLGLHRLDGSFDSENMMICEDKTALEFGHMLFCSFLRISERVNATAIINSLKIILFLISPIFIINFSF
jgi:predicted transcriptional regulator